MFTWNWTEISYLCYISWFVVDWGPAELGLDQSYSILICRAMSLLVELARRVCCEGNLASPHFLWGIQCFRQRVCKFTSCTFDNMRQSWFDRAFVYSIKETAGGLFANSSVQNARDSHQCCILSGISFHRAVRVDLVLHFSDRSTRRHAARAGNCWKI